MVSMIDRYLLRYFLAVVDYGNFSKAAARCNVSQPTLSVGIAKLERLLDRPLFHRTNRRVELTAAGAQFTVHARRIESEFNLAERNLAANGPRRTFRLGVLVTLPSPWISALASKFAEDCSREQIELVEGRERDLIERLARGRIDVALTIIRPDETRFTSEVLLTEAYSLALPRSHPLAHEAVIPAEALADSAMIVRRHCELLPETSRHFTARGVRPFFAARTMNDDRALALVQAGLGLTVMPDGYAAPGVTRPRLANFDFIRKIGVLYAALNDVSAAAPNPALSAIRSTFADIATGIPNQSHAGGQLHQTG
jgi:DNA-binding transcriptional LysR family regulator